MSLTHNGRDVFDLPPTDRLFDRLELFYGRELAESLIWIENESADCRLWGYVGHPSQTKSSRKGQYLFLNGRPISDRSLSHALTESYRGLVMVGRQPIAFLFLDMPAELADVNVHPTKAEVRFQDSQQHYRMVLSTIRTTFLGLPLETSLRVDPTTALDTAGAAGPHQQQLSISPSRGTSSSTPLNWSSPNQSAAAPAPPDRLASDFTTPVGPVSGPAAAAVAVPIDHDADRPVTTDAGVRGIQVHDCYLVIETAEGVAVIDQHALHERVLYEQFKQRVLEGRVEQQNLLVPETVELSAGEAAVIGESAELLGSLGFSIEAFGTNTVLLQAYPAMLRRPDFPELLRDLAQTLEQPGQSPQRRDILEALLQMMACKAAIKSGYRLSTEEMASLLEQSHLIDDAHHCPHGRPTALVLSRNELDRQFGRLG